MKFITAIFFKEEQGDDKGKDKVLYEVNPYDSVVEACEYTKQKANAIRKERKIEKDVNVMGRTFQSGCSSYDLRR